MRLCSALPSALRTPGSARAFKGSLAFLGAQRANRRRRGRKREACAIRATVGVGVPQSDRRGSGAEPRAEPRAGQRAAAAGLPEAPLGGAPRAASEALVLLWRVPAPEGAAAVPRPRRPGARRGRARGQASAALEAA